MREEVLILYSCDTWHTPQSKILAGVFSCRERLDNHLQAMHRDHVLSDDDLQMLREQNQTQGHDINYRVEESPVDLPYRRQRA